MPHPAQVRVQDAWKCIPALTYREQKGHKAAAARVQDGYRQTYICIEGVSEPGHTAAHALVLFCLGIPGCQQEGAEPLDLPALPLPGSYHHQVQGIPQALAVIPAVQCILKPMRHQLLTVISAVQ